MLCWMHDNEAHRGFAELPSGFPLLSGDIAAKVGKSEAAVNKLLGEMERVGIYSRDDRGCVYSRRMARDTHISIVRSAAAKSRLDKSKRAADGSFAGDFDPANGPAKSKQNPTVTASASVSVSDSSKTPPTPASGETLFDEQTSTNSPSVVRPDVPPAPQKRKNGSGHPMSSEQREWLNEFLTFHPKNTIQTASATKLWAERVKDKPCFEWLMVQLKRECAGDTTYLHGPGKWLADHLELYAAGVEAHSVRRSGKPDPVLDLMEENFKRSGRIFA